MTEYEVLWTQTARQDLEGIIGYIADDSIDRALSVANRIEHRCRELHTLPARGRVIPELRAVDVMAYRELIEGPWRIVYRYDAERVHVVAVLDARRDLSSLLLERLVR